MAATLDQVPATETTLEGFDAVRLAAGELEAVFVPELGMVGASLTHAGEELLDRRDGLEAYRAAGTVMGLPLLHPWANRLGGDEYWLHGRRVRLGEVLRDDNGLPIHGLVGANAGWELLAAGPARLRARLDFAADPRLHAGFPFAHELVLDIALTTEALTVATTVRPTGGAPVPVSFGFHPYLRLPGAPRADWIVAMPRRRHLELDERGLPTGGAVHRAAARLLLGDRSFDDAFDGIAAGAAFSVSAAGRTLSLTHECGFPVAQVYSPSGEPFICFEPMAAPVDALRSGAGLRRAVPGHPVTARFSIRVEA